MAYSLKVCEARNLVRKEGPANPICVITNGKNRFSTKQAKIQASATWNDEFTFDFDPKDDKVVIEVWHENSKAKENLIGTATLKTKDLTDSIASASKSDRWIEIKKGKLRQKSKGEVRIVFDRAEQMGPGGIQKKYTERMDKLSINDFDLVTVLGKGTFGKVMLVKKKDNGQTYAMKSIHKAKVIEKNEIERTLGEKNVLKSVLSPFLVGLKFSFQSEDKLYFILDYVAGGELFHHLQQEKRFSEDRVRFYAAELLCGLEALHSKGIVYRDLKPENILLDEQGHIKITDFGLCKELKNPTRDKTSSFVGTPEYFAPEILKGEEYGKDVDWWSLGTLIFEMLVGLPPFYDENLNEMFQQILTGELQFPDFVSPDARDLITRLLDRDPKKRLGSGPSDARAIKAHPFFRTLDWDKLERREIPAPFVPKLKSTLDTSHFDKEFTNQAPVDSVVNDSALNDKDQQLFEGFTYVSQSAMNG